MRAKYLEIPINTVVASGAIELVVGTTASAGIAAGTATSDSQDKLVDSGATFVADGVVVGDIAYNVTDGTQAAITAVNANGQEVSFASDLFPAGTEAYAIRKEKQLNAVGSTFTTRKVRVGDTVTNTTASTTTTVAALINETSLTLTADIFNSPTLYNDNFTIEAPATEVYDNGKTFLTTMNIGDVYENTTQNFSEVVVSVIDDFRFKCSSSAGAIGDAFNVFDSTVASTYLVLMDQIVLVDRVGAEQSRIFLNIMGQTNNYITIDHSDQGSGRAVAIAIQDAMKRGYVGVNMPDPPGPSAARVQMPIFEGSVVTVESVVLS
tara:strand:- start:21219 stop:22184 length:966 start_codon:yes stop_codon:yes gene_type:complete